MILRSVLVAAAVAVSFGFSNPSNNTNLRNNLSMPHAKAILAVIDLSEQRMKVYKYGWPVHTWKVSTARRGYVTPTGNYQPYRMHKKWYSRKYNMSPMPYSVFYHRGYAIHGTKAVRRLGQPASHGCIRLKISNAKALFNLIKAHGGMKAARVVIRQ